MYGNERRENEEGQAKSIIVYHISLVTDDYEHRLCLQEVDTKKDQI